LRLNVTLAAAKHYGLQAAHQMIKVLIPDRTAPVVEFVEVAVEAEQRAQQARIKVLDDRVDFVDAILDRRAGKHKRVG
jgi:hypothetical protein